MHYELFLPLVDIGEDVRMAQAQVAAEDRGFEDAYDDKGRCRVSEVEIAEAKADRTLLLYAEKLERTAGMVRRLAAAAAEDNLALASVGGHSLTLVCSELTAEQLTQAGLMLQETDLGDEDDDDDDEDEEDD
jgi:hypothetical protein